MGTIKVSNAAAVSSLLLLALVGACGPKVAASPKDADVLEQVSRKLRSRGFVDPHSYSQVLCTEFFDVREMYVVDRQVDDITARVKVRARIHVRDVTQSNAFVDRNCYGAPNGGWRADETADFIADYKFEKWDSGWRLVLER